jgi:hypothetical protein
VTHKNPVKNLQTISIVKLIENADNVVKIVDPKSDKRITKRRPCVPAKEPHTKLEADIPG